MIEILITGILLASAGYILFKTLNKKRKGQCNCGSCSSRCPQYRKKDD